MCEAEVVTVRILVSIDPMYDLHTKSEQFIKLKHFNVQILHQVFFDIVYLKAD